MGYNKLFDGYDNIHQFYIHQLTSNLCCNKEEEKDWDLVAWNVSTKTTALYRTAICEVK